MIYAYLTAEESTRTPEKACQYTATTEVDGVVYTARSRSGAGHALARVLVEAGVADQPMEVRQIGVGGYFIYPSLAKAALRTVLETATAPLQSAKWRDPSFAWPGTTRSFAQKGG